MAMKWSLNTYQTAQNWELDELIRQAKAAGFDGIEFLMDFDQKHGVEANADPEWLRAVKEKIDASGLEFASVTSCASFHSLNDAERAEAMDRAAKSRRQHVARGRSSVASASAARAGVRRRRCRWR